jgi:transcriptional regulator with XRE-family HTH domain
METIPRSRSSVGVDAERLTYELGRRSITAEALAGRAGIAPAMLSRIRHGHGCSAKTLRAISDALLSFPVHAGADALITRPDRGEPGE